MQQIAVFYTTVETAEQGTKLINLLLQKKLVACAIMLPASSFFWWNNVIQDAQEIAIVCKTTLSLINRVFEEIKQQHPYQIPCIISTHVMVNDAYAQWLETATKQ